jgi:hypothetical protein
MFEMNSQQDAQTAYLWKSAEQWADNISPGTISKNFGRYTLSATVIKTFHQTRPAC